MNIIDPGLRLERLAEWYPNGLYIIPESTGNQPKINPVQKKKFLFLSGDPVAGNQQLTDLLTGIINACKINMKDVNIIAWSGSGDYKQMLEQYGSSFVILFGVEPAQLDLPIVFPHFQLQHFNDTTWISSPDLSVIHHDKLMKSKLWLCLKQAFSL